MNCNEVKDNLSLYIDDELSEDEKKSMDEHFKACPDCSRELEEYKKIIQALKELPDEEPPAGYCKRLKEKLLIAKQSEIPEIPEIPEMHEIKKETGIQGAVKTPEIKRRAISRWIKYGGLAAALVLVVLVYGLNRGGAGSSNQKMEYSTSESAPQEAPAAEAPEEQAKIMMDSRAGDEYSEYEAENGNDAVYGEAGAGGTEGQTSPTAAEDREIKIIRTGNIYAWTKDYEKFMDEMTAKVEAWGGYIENNTTEVYQAYEDDKLMRGNLKIRVPQEKFDEAVSYLEEAAEVRRKNISEADATKEYYEKDNKVKNLEVQEQNLRELFEKAATVEEMLQIENELNRVRTEIDSLNISLADIDDRASMSTIDLEVEEVKEADFTLKSEEGVWKRAREGFISTVNGIARGIENLIVDLVSSSPLLVPAIIIFIILLVKIKKYWRKKL